MILPWTKAQSGFYYGCDFGMWLDEEVIIGFDPKTKTIETLCSIFHSVFPQALPVELKGIAV